MNGIIITSEKDKNYYIVNTGAYAISVLSSILMSIDEEEINNKLLEVSKITEDDNQILFVSKISELGKILEKLKDSRQLIDDNEIITEKHLLNILVDQSIKDNNTVEYLKFIIKMIKNKSLGTIDELKEKYSVSTLRKINKDARYIWNLNKNSDNRKYYKEIYMTGYESRGLTYHDNKWYYIDIVNKSMVPVQSNRIKQRLISDDKK